MFEEFTMPKEAKEPQAANKILWNDGSLWKSIWQLSNLKIQANNASKERSEHWLEAH